MLDDHMSPVENCAVKLRIIPLYLSTLFDLWSYIVRGEGAWQFLWLDRSPTTFPMYNFHRKSQKFTILRHTWLFRGIFSGKYAIKRFYFKNDLIHARSRKSDFDKDCCVTKKFYFFSIYFFRIYLTTILLLRSLAAVFVIASRFSINSRLDGYIACSILRTNLPCSMMS